jgi:hypothetical protein
MSKNIFLILISLFCLYIGIFKASPPATSDLLAQVELCFVDGQIPCRWSIDAHNQLGSFQLNSIPPLVYYIALLFRLFGLSYQYSLILTNILFVAISTYFIYSKFKQNIFTTFSILLISFFTNSILPLTFLILFLYYSRNRHIQSSLFIGFLILSITKIYILPTLIITFIITKLFNQTKTKQLIYSVILGLLFSAFYIGPAFLNSPTSNFEITNQNLNQPTTISGQAILSQFRKRSNFWRLTAEVAGDQPANVNIPISYHPFWKILIDQQPTIPQNKSLSKPTQIIIPPGNHTVVAFLENDTPTFIFNLITLITIIYIFIVTFPYHEKKSS